MIMSLKLVETIYDTNYTDLPAMFKKAGEMIELEQSDDSYVKTTGAVVLQLSEDNQISIYGWGKIGVNEIITVLERAKNKLITNME